MIDWHANYKRERQRLQDAWGSKGYLITKWNDSQMIMPIVGRLTCKTCWCSVEPEFHTRHNDYHTGGKNG